MSERVAHRHSEHPQLRTAAELEEAIGELRARVGALEQGPPPVRPRPDGRARLLKRSPDLVVRLLAIR